MKHTDQPDKTEDGFTIIYNPADVPEFASEADEAAYWDTHTWNEKLLEQAASAPRNPHLPPPRDRFKVQSRPTSLRLETNTTERLKRLAEKKGLAYQTLLKQFVLERLYEEEKREGLR